MHIVHTLQPAAACASRPVKLQATGGCLELVACYALRLPPQAACQTPTLFRPNLRSLACRYGEYTQDQDDTFTLPPHLSLFPQFMFYLRRSQFLQVAQQC